MSTTLLEDQVQALRELNRAFLTFLQQRARGGAVELGFPRSAEGLLRTASNALLDALAEFPSPLFRLELDRPTDGSSVQRLQSEADCHLGSAVLHTVRSTARQSAYHAQVLFGLQAAEVARCRALTFDELRLLACSPGLIRCAHAERPWLWHALLGAVRPEERRQIALIALQPQVPQGWPARRPPHYSR